MFLIRDSSPRTRRRTAVPAGLAAAAVLVLLPAGTAQAAPGHAPRATALAETCRGVSTVGLYCGYHTGTAWAERGSVGAHVKEIQALINETTRYAQAGGSKLAVDGVYGPATEGAVTWFQWYYIGVSASDGIVGPRTWEELRHGDR
ncbi:peptidoglycan-binding domain-containing protein [Streptomyces ziwulingensis]